MFRLGVISDTHNFLDPKVHQFFAGVEHILHAGDIGTPRIILDLEAIAPVTSVMGNTDDPGFHYPLIETVTLAKRKFLVHHIVDPHHLTDELQRKIAYEQPDVVVFGHTHKPFSASINGTLFFNPGYAGKQRFELKRSVALLVMDESRMESEYLTLG
jgi:putative phosphoesterase